MKPYLEVDYAFINDPDKLEVQVNKFKKVTTGFRGKATQLSVILMKLCRKLAVQLVRKDLVFDPRRGTIYTKRSGRLLVSIKDPFMKEINYGVQMRDKEKRNAFVDVLKSFMKAAADNAVDEFFLQRAEVVDVSQGSSINQTTLSNAGSPASSGEEERKDSHS